MDIPLASTGGLPTSAVLLLLGLVSAACVSLAKPDPVEEACPTPNAATCVNQAVEKRDAGQATHDAARRDSATKPPRDARADGDADDKELPVTDAASALPEITDDRAAEPPSAPEPSPEPSPELPPEPEAELPPEPSPDRIPMSTPEPRPDAGMKPDGAAATCANAKVINGNGIASISTNAFDTVGTYCFVTCDNILYWGCSSFNSSDGSAGQNRTVVVNGITTKCGAKLPPKTPSGYYYFELGPGGHVWDSLWWLGPPSASCPTAGFAP